MKISIDPQTNVLKIETNKIRDYVTLFDNLGEHDVVMANEIHPDYIACEGILYQLEISNCSTLMNIGVVELSMIKKVEDCENEDFIKWYFNIID